MQERNRQNNPLTDKILNKMEYNTHKCISYNMQVDDSGNLWVKTHDKKKEGEH